MTNELLNDWTNDDFHILEQGVLCAQHRLLETGLFTDENLIHIIDSHPADCLTFSTMGNDASKFDWRSGDRNGVPADEILEILKRGQVWINVRKILDHQPEYARLVHQLYDELEAQSPGFRAQQRSANLLISSPTVHVPYHVDIPVNMLWHVRGEKRVWVYPHFDSRFVSQQVIEMVCSGELSEDVPYDTEFDKYALVFDVQPGQLLTWPQHTPHRVMNLAGLNVSLSTEHKNPVAIRRCNIHLANQFLRRRLRIPSTSTNVHGWQAHAKQAIARAVRLLQRMTDGEHEPYTYPVSFRLNPNTPTGVEFLDVDEELLVAPHQASELK